jgi:hypothetical protein
MKNIHILPTEKPSRLFYDINLRLLFEPYLMKYSQNIYITNDEEIKEGEYFLNTLNNAVLTNLSVINSNFLKKIILTTDQDLIKYGVQAIDDDFLQWFVNNSSYEEVNIKSQHVDEFGNYIDDSFHSKTDLYSYKIIIPKEEPEQDYSGVHFRHCYQGEYEDVCKYGEDDCPAKPKEELKQEFNIIDEWLEKNGTSEIKKQVEQEAKELCEQETLEEGLLQHIKFCLECKNESQAIRLIEKYGFEKQEQDKNKFNEEDLEDAYMEGGDCDTQYKTFQEWFEQFKNK